MWNWGRLPAPPCLDDRRAEPGDAVNALSSRADTTPAAVPALREAVARATRRYLNDRGDCEGDSLYALMLVEMETALLGEVMRHCEGNQSRAAAVLGINRSTLRKKLEAVGLLP